ncbi:hypothetical protein [Microbacterium sp.]|uniref:hypothetical protein n=1 Tax=Microbacterium sp. TaxID=51671 RepID=UPI003342A625
MIAQRWEKERGVWVLHRSRPGTSARRRAELLKQRASRISRAGVTGVAESARHEDITPSLFRRMLATNDGAKEQMARLIWVPLIFLMIGLAVGPAMLLAAAIYAGLWWHSPKIGRLWDWPWYIAGGVVATVLFLVGTFMEATPTFTQIWGWIQLPLGLLFVGLHIQRCGWAAVRPLAGAGKTGPKKNADGSFKRIADEDVVQLTPFTDDSSEKYRDAPAAPIAPVVPSIPLGVLAPEPDTDPDEPDDEDWPIFDDDELFDEPETTN